VLRKARWKQRVTKRSIKSVSIQSAEYCKCSLSDVMFDKTGEAIDTSCRPDAMYICENSQ
jgi:hypothetical protein